jgi:hypothetical protein
LRIAEGFAAKGRDWSRAVHQETTSTLPVAPDINHAKQMLVSESPRCSQAQTIGPAKRKTGQGGGEELGWCQKLTNLLAPFPSVERFGTAVEEQKS